MVATKLPPSGFDQILALGDAVKTARALVVEKEQSVAVKEGDLERDKADLVKLRADLAKVERKFQELVLSGVCTDANCDHHDHAVPMPTPHEEVKPKTPPTPKATGANKRRVEQRRRKASTLLEPGLYFADIPKKLQLALIIEEVGELDYADAAFRIYSRDDANAKARINALMTELRREGLVGPSQGQRRYALTIDRDELMARSRAAARR